MSQFLICKSKEKLSKYGSRLNNVVSNRELYDKVIDKYMKNENIDDIKIKAVLEKNLDKYDLGEEVGYLEIITPSNKIFKYKIYASNEVKGINFFMYLINIFKRLFA